MLGSAGGSDEAGLAPASTFLLAVDKAVQERDQIVMEPDRPAPAAAPRQPVR